MAESRTFLPTSVRKVPARDSGASRTDQSIEKREKAYKPEYAPEEEEETKKENIDSGMDEMHSNGKMKKVKTTKCKNGKKSMRVARQDFTADSLFGRWRIHGAEKDVAVETAQPGIVGETDDEENKVRQGPNVKRSAPSSSASAKVEVHREEAAEEVLEASKGGASPEPEASVEQVSPADESSIESDSVSLDDPLFLVNAHSSVGDVLGEIRRPEQAH